MCKYARCYCQSAMENQTFKTRISLREMFPLLCVLFSSTQRLFCNYKLLQNHLRPTRNMLSENLSCCSLWLLESQYRATRLFFQPATENRTLAPVIQPTCLGTAQLLIISVCCSLWTTKFSPLLLTFLVDHLCSDTMWKFHPSQQLEINFLIVNLFNNLSIVCYDKHQIIHIEIFTNKLWKKTMLETEKI